MASSLSTAARHYTLPLPNHSRTFYERVNTCLERGATIGYHLLYRGAPLSIASDERRELREIDRFSLTRATVALPNIDCRTVNVYICANRLYGNKEHERSYKNIIHNRGHNQVKTKLQYIRQCFNLCSITN